METEDSDGIHLVFYPCHRTPGEDHDFNNISGYIVPINTRGLWGKIHGYLAL